jgi:hypothetical protein
MAPFKVQNLGRGAQSDPQQRDVVAAAQWLTSAAASDAATARLPQCRTPLPLQPSYMFKLKQREPLSSLALKSGLDSVLCGTRTETF